MDCCNKSPLALTVTVTATRIVELVEVRTMALLDPMGSNVVLGNMEKNIGVWSKLMMNRWSWLLALRTCRTSSIHAKASAHLLFKFPKALSTSFLAPSCQAV
jgi:hypothetical protein